MKLDYSLHGKDYKCEVKGYQMTDNHRTKCSDCSFLTPTQRSKIVQTFDILKMDSILFFRKFDPGKRARELFNALDVDGEQDHLFISDDFFTI